MKLPPLRAVQYFEVVARLLSFSRAALELNVSQSAVSHQIRLLEDFLGERLLLRQGRLLSLTPQGEIYFEGIAAGLVQIAQSSEQLRGGGEMRVRLAVYSSFAVKWLIPRLAGLRQLYPELDLSLEMVAEDPELSDRVADGFITVSPEGPGYMHDLLYRERLMPVCSRRMWQQVEGEWPATLWQLPLLSIQAIYREKGEDWRRWAEMGGLTIPPRRGCTISAISCSRWRRRTGTREWRSSMTTCCSRKIRVWCGCPCTPSRPATTSISSSSARAPMNPPSAGCVSGCGRSRRRA